MHIHMSMHSEHVSFLSEKKKKTRPQNQVLPGFEPGLAEIEDSKSAVLTSTLQDPFFRFIKLTMPFVHSL